MKLATKKTETEIMLAIVNVYDGLSPECLSGDGMYTNSQIKANSSRLFTELAELEKELGRKVDVNKAYDWYAKNIKAKW